MKIKIIAIIMAILIIVINVPVYAENTLPAPPSDAYEYWVYMITEAGTIYFITSTNPITVLDEEGRSIKFNGNGKDYIYRGNEWENYMGYNEGQSTWMPTWLIVAANHDIAYDDGSGFFFECPKVSPLVQGMTGTDFGTIFRNFSVGLIPIAGLIVSLIAFRKAWAFLRSQLQS